jgi:hypothetical protein
MKIANIHRYFDAEGNYHGPLDYKIVVAGVEHDLYEYAKQHGIELPGSKKHKKAKIEVNSNADMGQTQSKGDSPEHGDGDSEGSE